MRALDPDPGLRADPAPDRVPDHLPDHLSEHALDRALHEERAYHDACRDALAAMVDGAQEQVVTGEDVSASGADAEVLGRRFRGDAKAMRELPPGPLFFGRLDFASGERGAGDHAGQSYHVGRLRITEHPASPPLVVDWRAPVARAFYQAGPRDPQGVRVRRRFGWAPGSAGEPGDLTGLEDEHLGVMDEPEPGSDGPGGAGSGGTGPGGTGREGTGSGGAGPGGAGRPGSAILAGEIERPRVGPMRDIAATIQPDQDDLVRRDLGTSLCVQGGPGTGKTAVGLHRAAYLLYTHPQRVQRNGLLVLGPNRTFLSYISEVLPSLGEGGVRQSTVVDEIATQPVRGTDSEGTAVVKHDARMARVLRNALYARVRPPADSLAVPDGSYRWRIGRAELERIVEDVRAEEPPYAVGRERVRTRAVRLVQEQAERRSGARPQTWLQRIGRSRPVGAFVDEVWPKVVPEQVVAELLADAGVLGRSADGVLDAEEQRRLLWPRAPRSYRSARWSAADLVLLDEVAGLIEHPRGYGHVVVDEAQDLSPMECRAIARRSAYGSLTVLGDLAQGTTPWAARAWPVLLGHLGRPDAVLAPLTVGFRVPAAVVEVTNRLLAALDVDVPPARSLRADGQLRTAEAADGAGVVDATVRLVREALGREGSVGVIAPDAGPVGAAALHTALAAAGLAPAPPDRLGARLTVLPASLAKGLEYDHVVAVEPAAVVEAERRGLERLYVVLTRAVSRLDVVHSRPLPF
ncbi:HelD family protein [Streptomyces luteolus]|uniref:AAA family ATPase n=1 Tax=Streptomyces luteolus TaxID=3043615 RepID=A0ABT6SQK1_9ACTN|nr:AAA family ATPase [Streptomyces sp. B-S-A12]MDI3417883.1 AAA family ATPase [Streptomyces sp. B-S-A12]